METTGHRLFSSKLGKLLMINEFSGPYSFLSNFYPARVVWEGITHKTSEHAYQAAKTLDVKQRESISKCKTPGQAKRRGAVISLRLDWNNIRVGVMHEIVREKFVQNEDLLVRLLMTGNRLLVEGNTWGDTFWGVCRGKGENNLGKILMRVREELKNGQ